MSTEAMFRYKAQGEVMIPDLKLPTETNYPLGKYAMMRLEYLKKHRRGTYTTLLTQAKLNEHLHEVEEAAKEQISMTIWYSKRWRARCQHLYVDKLYCHSGGGRQCTMYSFIWRCGASVSNEER